jgi:Fe-S oxidoreductase
MELQAGGAGEYNVEDCIACGECLAACPYMRLSAGRARREMQRLRRGAHSMVLEQCAGCATCNAACVLDCRPYSLIRQRWNQRFQLRALPLRARFLLPHSKPNFRSAMALSPQEQHYTATLRRAPSAPRALFAGCNALLLPYQLQSRLWRGLEVFGSLDFCCGEMYYRMGLYEYARQSALRLQALFAHTPVQDMVFLCSACYNMLANVYPREFGVELPFKKTFATEFLREKLNSGALRFDKPLNQGITIHDSCHAKLMGGALWDETRDMLIRAGAEVVEPEHTRENSLCCGVAAGCSRFSPVDLAATGARRLLEFDRTGPARAAAYCNGCYLTLESVRHAVPARTPVEPLWDLLMQASGEPVPHALRRTRTRQMLTGVLSRAMPDVLRPAKRFRPDPIEPLRDVQGND